MYREHFSTKKTPQSEPVPGRDQAENYAGGYVFEISPWDYLDRFLILGTEGGTYYAREKELTVKACRNVLQCIKMDGARVVNRIVEISEQGRAPKNDPALFGLAMCISLGDTETKRLAAKNLEKVARTGTHLFHFVHYVDGFRGWGSLLRSAILNWYLGKDTFTLAYQVAKYKQRDGYSHRDLLRLSHPKPENPSQNAVFAWICQKKFSPAQEALKGTAIEGYELAKSADKYELINLIEEYKLTHEMIPTDYKNDPEIQWALIQQMPYMALIRNLGNFAKTGLLKQGKFNVIEFIEEKITNQEKIKRSRVHPIHLLLALKTYASGKGFRGSGAWPVVPSVVTALNEAFYSSFKFLKPTGLRHYIGLDCSGSMSSSILNTNLDVIEAACSMAMTRLMIEKRTVFKGFAYAKGYGTKFGHRFRMEELGITREDTLNVATKKALALNWGGTDCSLPMIDALEEKTEIDIFEILTDNETWAGKIHPFQALQNYRKKMGIPAKLVVWGMTATKFSIADPNDPGMLDIVGFDSSAPQIINEFAK